MYSINIPCQIGDVVWVVRKYRGAVGSHGAVVKEIRIFKNNRILIVAGNNAARQWGKDVLGTVQDADGEILKRKS